jgi:hypothetical protein
MDNATLETKRDEIHTKKWYQKLVSTYGGLNIIEYATFVLEELKAKDPQFKLNGS